MFIGNLLFRGNVAELGGTLTLEVVRSGTRQAENSMLMTPRPLTLRCHWPALLCWDSRPWPGGRALCVTSHGAELIDQYRGKGIQNTWPRLVGSAVVLPFMGDHNRL